MNCQAGNCEEGFFVAYEAAYAFRYPNCQHRSLMKSLPTRLSDFCSLVLKTYSGKNPSGVYVLQLEIFCLETVLGILPPRSLRAEDLTPGYASVHALTKAICDRTSDIVFRGQDSRAFYQYEGIWRWRKRRITLFAYNDHIDSRRSY